MMIMKNFYALLLAMTLFCGAVVAQSPKREFRGVWMPTVTGEYSYMSEKDMKAKLTSELDLMEKTGINAVFFQIRPASDAWYKSNFEPWSRYITGTQGKDPGWDPTRFMIDECHKRGIEFHAWINPYRVKTSPSTALSANHYYNRHPELFFEYGGQTFFDPSRQESRDFICNVIMDIVMNYDVDAIHMDDYFYPYPKPGEKIPDEVAFRGNSRGFSDIGDWRRDNVNKLIKKIHETLMATAPWVQFGISPFGIYRNQSSDPKGSHTKGLQNYDQLYADVLLWAKEGWIDYLVPQIYWEIGHPAADYAELLKWWSKNATGCRLYIGQDILRTASPDCLGSQQRAKFDLLRANGCVDGYCLYPVKQLVANPGNYTNLLKSEYNTNPALPPVVGRLESSGPHKVRKVKVVDTGDGKILFWSPGREKKAADKAVKFCVYRFESKKNINIENGQALKYVTTDNFIKLPDYGGNLKYYYVVTAVDRFNNESGKVVKKIKL